MELPENTEKERVRIVSPAPEDAEGLTNVFYKTWLATYPNKKAGITREDIEDSYKDSFSEQKLQKMRENIASIKENEKRAVAKYGQLIVGTATMVRNNDNNQLKTIYVLPEFQGKGIGKMLWDEVKSFCDSSKDIIVQVAIYNEGAIEFYKKLGFVDTGKRWSDDKWKMKSGATIPEMEMIIKASDI